MQGLQRRPSGIYVFRLAVPEYLRRHVGKREIIESTGSRDFAIAKIAAAAAHAIWRQRFLELGRLAAGSICSSMDPHEIVRVAAGSPLLLTGGFLPLAQAASASGLTQDSLLRAAADGRLRLHARLARVKGHLVHPALLEPEDPAAGHSSGVVIPAASQMPGQARQHIADGIHGLTPGDDMPVANSILSGEASVALIAFQATEGSEWFVPEQPVVLTVDRVEVLAAEVEALRRTAAATIDPGHLADAKKAVESGIRRASAKGGERLSTALKHYIDNRVVHDMTNAGEIKRVRNGCHLLIELEGDVPLTSMTTERLRDFKNLKLALVPANENKVRLIHGTTTVKESIDLLRGTTYEVMSAAERDKRMRWISAWFRWLKGQKWLDEDPTEALRGETVVTKVERRKISERREDESRQLFDAGVLSRIFSVPWFETGKGKLTEAETFREYLPYYYWAPLLALLGGGRVNEIAQLHLADLRQTPAGQWYVDYNSDAPDKRLKNTASKRQVPIHPLLVSLGLIEWRDTLAAQGHTRLFPELKIDLEKGYGKAVTKWFARFMSALGYKRDGTLTFHSFRHTFTNALPGDTPERVEKQLTGHTRGKDVHDRTYKKDLPPDQAAAYIDRLGVSLPVIAPFDIDAGLQALNDALARKQD